MKVNKKIFAEVGLDFDNNKWGFGRSVEIEFADGTELRTKEKIKLTKIDSRYVRIWIGKFVFVMDSKAPYFALKKKKRWNFKIVYGKFGK